jgi:hypothetical protein
MTTYTTPHFATGIPDRSNVRPDPALNRARTASAAPYRTAGVTNEAALMSDGQTPDWQPGVSKGVPKAAIGALGAALVGGVALAIVLMAPSNKVTKQVMPDPIAQAAADNTAPAKSADASTDVAVNQMDKEAPAAGNTAAAATTSTAATAAGAEPVAPAPVQAVIPDAPPVTNAPVAHVTKAKAAPVATPRVAPQPVQSAPVVTPDTTITPTVTPPADVQPPAMQQTPETPTVTPSTPAPAPTPDTPAPTPAPAQ